MLTMFNVMFHSIALLAIKKELTKGPEMRVWNRRVEVMGPTALVACQILDGAERA